MLVIVASLVCGGHDRYMWCMCLFCVHVHVCGYGGSGGGGGELCASCGGVEHCSV